MTDAGRIPRNRPLVDRRRPVCALMAFAPSANAAITSVFSGTAAPIPCAAQASGVRLCDQTIAGNPGETAAAR